MSYRCLKDVNHIFIAAGHHILVDPRWKIHIEKNIETVLKNFIRIRIFLNTPKATVGSKIFHHFPLKEGIKRKIDDDERDDDYLLTNLT